MLKHRIVIITMNKKKNMIYDESTVSTVKTKKTKVLFILFFN